MALRRSIVKADATQAGVGYPVRAIRDLGQLEKRVRRRRPVSKKRNGLLRWLTK